MNVGFFVSVIDLRIERPDFGRLPSRLPIRAAYITLAAEMFKVFCSSELARFGYDAPDAILVGLFATELPVFHLATGSNRLCARV